MKHPICEVCELPVKEGQQLAGFPRPIHEPCHGIAVAQLASEIDQWRDSPEGREYCHAQGLKWTDRCIRCDEPRARNGPQLCSECEAEEEK